MRFARGRGAVCASRAGKELNARFARGGRGGGGSDSLSLSLSLWLFVNKKEGLHPRMPRGHVFYPREK